jgi:hypothetical protein
LRGSLGLFPKRYEGVKLKRLNVIPRSWRLPLEALGIAGLVVAVRLVFEVVGLERISLTPLIATIITADVFVLGFLLSGVLADYKESEKLPGELAVSIESIAQECLLLWRHKEAEPARDCLVYLEELTDSLRAWFRKRERTQILMDKVWGLGNFFHALEPYTQANFIVRLKQEQAALSRHIMRIDTIRETDFVSSGSTMAKVITVLVVGGLSVLKLDPWYESVFVTGVIAWFLSYLIMLIADLDNPFDYNREGRADGQEVSLKPLDDFEKKIHERLLAQAVPFGSDSVAS